MTIRADWLRYQNKHYLENRSAVINQALEQFWAETLAQEYRDASCEWDASEEAAIWNRALGDDL